jgi:catechol 2,3-dioxygenase-like lactoylglutathione lyase family enzyme
MERRPGYVIKTVDFGKSLAFYRDGIGYEILQEQPEAELAILNAEELSILLVGPKVEDLTAHAAEGHRVLRQGIFRNSADIDPDRAKLEQAGISGIAVEDKPWGDRVMRVPTPEGLTVTYTAGAKRSQEEDMALLTNTPQQLEDALAGLSEADLNMKREESGWSIRQVVHHMTDAQVKYLVELTTALTEPGSHYASNWRANDMADTRLHYAERPIDSAVALFRASSLSVAQMIGFYPNYRELDYMIRDGHDPHSEGQKQKMSDTVRDMLSHGLEHIYEVKEIRKANGK